MFDEETTTPTPEEETPNEDHSTVTPEEEGAETPKED